MRNSGIGGQAVMEGIMMKNGDEYALAVRTPEKTIEVIKDTHKSLCGPTIKKIPFVRGALAFIDSLILGISTLMRSSLIAMDEDEEEEKEKKNKKAKKKTEPEAEKPAGHVEKAADETEKGKELSAGDKAFMGLTLLVSLVIAIAVFVVAPLFITGLFRKHVTQSPVILAVIEGAIKIIIFLGYLIMVSHMKDIQRTFMYHGSEHKCINCIESGLELTVDNVRASSRFHKRCGTSFLFYVVIVSVVIGFFIQGGSGLIRLVLRLVLLPVIAGISYEFIRLAGCSDNKAVELFAKPGLAMQKLTTIEPEDDMIEVAIQAVEAVFDWRDFLAGGDGKKTE